MGPVDPSVNIEGYDISARYIGNNDKISRPYRALDQILCGVDENRRRALNPGVHGYIGRSFGTILKFNLRLQ